MMDPSLDDLPSDIERALLDQDFWESPAIDKQRKGDRSVEPIYVAVGAALSGWEQLEDALGFLFAILLKANAENSLIIKRVFGRVQSSGTRRSMIHEAAEVYFGDLWKYDQIRRPLTSLLAAISSASRRRDEIAHGSASSYTVNGIEGGAFLLSVGYDASNNDIYAKFDKDDVIYSTSKYRYTFSDINEMGRKFNQLRMYIFLYASGIQLEHGIPGNALRLIKAGVIRQP